MATTAVQRNPSRRSHNSRHRRRKSKGVITLDSISSLPDVILQHILSFIRTEDAIKTSLLSKRWRYVWRKTPSLHFSTCKLDPDSIHETLTRYYNAPKMTSFLLFSSGTRYLPHFDRWIELAMSRKVENLCLELWLDKSFTLPDYFYRYSYVKELDLRLHTCDMMMIPSGSVNWRSLKTLSLHGVRFSNDSLSEILNGSPLLESLMLHFCVEIVVLNLGKLARLGKLEIQHHSFITGPTQIVAPQIGCLVMRNFRLPCSLADVSSLNGEAQVNISSFDTNDDDAAYCQVMVLEMLDKLKKVEKLTLGGNFLRVLSLCEIRGLHFPMLKIKALTLETTSSISPCLLPGVERILQNSSGLKKLTIYTRHCNAIMVEYLDAYLDLIGLDTETCWRISLECY